MPTPYCCYYDRLLLCRDLVGTTYSRGACLHVPTAYVRESQLTIPRRFVATSQAGGGGANRKYARVTAPTQSQIDPTATQKFPRRDMVMVMVACAPLLCKMFFEKGRYTPFADCPEVK